MADVLFDRPHLVASRQARFAIDSGRPQATGSVQRLFCRSGGAVLPLSLCRISSFC